MISSWNQWYTAAWSSRQCHPSGCPKKGGVCWSRRGHDKHPRRTYRYIWHWHQRVCWTWVRSICRLMQLPDLSRHSSLYLAQWVETHNHGIQHRKQMSMSKLFTYLSPLYLRLISRIFSRFSDFISCPYIGCPKKLVLLPMIYTFGVVTAKINQRADSTKWKQP